MFRAGYQIIVTRVPDDPRQPGKPTVAFIETGSNHSPEDALAELHRMLEVSSTLRSMIVVRPAYMKEVFPNVNDS